VTAILIWGHAVSSRASTQGGSGLWFFQVIEALIEVFVVGSNFEERVVQDAKLSLEITHPGSRLIS
jgi:hypothetical protein